MIVVLIAWDVVTDYQDGAGWPDVLFELCILLAAAGGMFILWRQIREVKSDLAHAIAEAEQWRAASRELIRGLGAAIEKQFDDWRLSGAEAEIGLFLLKGLSHKEIAQIRQTSERTIREQARALYRKAGLSGGRSSLSAYFLEDLLLPRSHDITTKSGFRSG
jgi:DNA-binding NarL/FixJ family response regulator